MLGVVLFPFVVMTVLMNRQDFTILVVTSGAGALSGTCFGCGRLLCYFPFAVGMVAHFNFLAAAAFLPVLGVITLPVAVDVLMFKHRNGFGLNMVADRAVTLSGASLGFGSRLRLFPIAVAVLRHIQLFTAGAFLPVLGIVIFPFFVVNIVRMDRNRLFLRIFADGAGALPGTLLRCGGRLRHAPIAEVVVARSILINFSAVAAFLPVPSRTSAPVVVNVLVFPVAINLLIAAGKAPPFTYVILRIYIIIDQLPLAKVMGALSDISPQLHSFQ